MTYDEYEALITKGVAEPEHAPEIFMQVLQELKADKTAESAMSQTISDNDRKIRELQDTNIRLFLGQTGAREEEPEEVEETYDDLLKNVKERFK